MRFSMRPHLPLLWLGLMVCPGAARGSYTHTVFLNFDGATLVQGGNNATGNVTSLISVPTLDYPAQSWDRFGGRAQGIQAALDDVRAIFSDFALTFVTQRPGSGDYTMAMIGGEGAGTVGGSGTGGLAQRDCDNLNKNDLCLIFGDLDSIKEPRDLARIIAHELGHTFGLEHVSDATGIMYPAPSPQSCCWVDSELAGPSQCQRDRQDDRQILMDNVGPGPGDAEDPRVWLVRPGRGAVLPPDVSFEVEAADNRKVHHVDIYVDGVKRVSIHSPPYTAALTRLSAGEHVLRVEASDFEPNTASVEVSFIVDVGCIMEGTCFGGQAGIGQTCAHGDDCMTGVCATQNGSSQCVDTCDRDDPAAVCPTGLTCSEGPDDWVCLPDAGWSVSLAADADGGGCNLVFPSTDPCIPAWLLVSGLMVLVGRRNRLRHHSRPSRISIARRIRIRPSS